MGATRWDPMKRVAAELGIDRGTLRRWCDQGYVQSRRDGPRLRFILVHAEGPAAGRPVGLDDQPAEEHHTT